MPTPLMPSSYQARVYDFVQHASGSAVVIAVAGSGKTTTILEALRLIPPSQSVQLFAFNTAIAAELRSRLPPALRHVHAATFHSVGYRALCTYFQVKSLETNGRKLHQIARQPRHPDPNTPVPRYVPDEAHWMPKGYQAFAIDLVSLAKGAGIGIVEPDTDEAWWRLVNVHDLELDDEEDEATGIQYARQLLARSNHTAEDFQIDFDDQLYLPCLWNLPVEKKDWVFVDEAQDVNPIRLELIQRVLKPGGRLIAVGDPNQCQPAGTVVEKAIKAGRFGVKERTLVPIESIKKGDYVSSYSFRDGRIYARKVTTVASRPYEGKLVHVTARNQDSRYTLNHRCVVRRRVLDYCVYVMQRGRNFRIGSSRTAHPTLGVGPLLRMRAEDAEAVWILQTYPTKREAQIVEAQLSAYYHLPQLMFTAKGGACQMTQVDLDSVWREINNAEHADRCLAHFGRLRAHPYFVRGQQQVSLKRPHECIAANLLLGSEMRLRTGEWAPILFHQTMYSGLVYSLEVEREQRYFADGILTHNSIYGFTGAMVDSLDQIRDRYEAIELPLSVSYRCPKAIVARAQTLVPQIEAAPEAPEGDVCRLSLADTLARLTAADAVLCRTNAPLVNLAYYCIRHQIGVQLLGRDLGKGLLSLIEKMHTPSIDKLSERLHEYRTREMQKFVERDLPAKAASVADKVDCLEAILQHLPEDDRTVAALQTSIRGLFGDDQDPKPRLTLSTVHKAKGKEWPQVAILCDFLMPAVYAREAWEREQEDHVQYVAWTRAKERLIFVQEDQGPFAPRPTPNWASARTDDRARREKGVRF